MKILLRPRLCGAALGHLFTKFFDAGGPVLPRVLALARAHGEALSFLRDLQFPPAELAAASHLEVICRTTVGQSRADADRTRAHYRQDALQPTASRWAVRLPSRIYLSKPVPAAAIAHVDQWTGEHVCGAVAAQALRGSGLTGWSLAPVLHPGSDAPRPGAEHLTTRELLPAALQDATTFETFDDGPAGPGQPRRHGLLSYAAGALDGSADFARTAEPWGEWRTPVWVVRQPVRAWFQAQGLRGWAFRPVLAEGTSLHASHLRQWQELQARLAEAGASVMA